MDDASKGIGTEAMGYKENGEKSLNEENTKMKEAEEEEEEEKERRRRRRGGGGGRGRARGRREQEVTRSTRKERETEHIYNRRSDFKKRTRTRGETVKEAKKKSEK